MHEREKLEITDSDIAGSSQLQSLHATAAAEAADQARMHLMSNLLHDLRTPLVSIRGYTKMMLEGRAGSVNATQQEYLAIVAENTNRVIQLLNVVVQLTSSQALRFEAFDMRDLCIEALRIPSLRAAAKSVTIKREIPSEPLLVLGDRQKLTDVFTDLILNAVKFSEPQGEVAVEISAHNENEVTVIISDKGVGIPSELFDKFATAGSTSVGPAAARENLAVGLSVIHDLIRMHGGQISVSSKAGEGVTFLISLPTL